MRMRNILILVVIVLLIAIVAVGYILMQSSENDTSNVTNGTINISPSDNNVGTSDNQNQQDQSSQSDIISASKAQAIASNYLSSSSKYSNFGAGSPTLKGDVYYVPMVVTSDDAQDAKGSVVGYVKVDAITGEVIGIESQDITTGQTINEPP